MRIFNSDDESDEDYNEIDSDVVDDESISDDSNSDLEREAQSTQETNIAASLTELNSFPQLTNTHKLSRIRKTRCDIGKYK